MLGLLLNLIRPSGGGISEIILDGDWATMTAVDWEDVDETDWDDWSAISDT